MVLCFFFFKQKTAYEMRISDWSSDVCSSDLPAACPRVDGELERKNEQFDRSEASRWTIIKGSPAANATGLTFFGPRRSSHVFEMLADEGDPVRDGYRSEEHTSELQSLMRISYAVFCLKKKKNRRNNTE